MVSTQKLLDDIEALIERTKLAEETRKAMVCVLKGPGQSHSDEELKTLASGRRKLYSMRRQLIQKLRPRKATAGSGK